MEKDRLDKDQRRALGWQRGLSYQWWRQVADGRDPWCAAWLCWLREKGLGRGVGGAGGTGGHQMAEASYLWAVTVLGDRR
jgi:hypothetical protein